MSRCGCHHGGVPDSHPLAAHKRSLALAGGIAGATMAAASASWFGAGAYLARMLLTPERSRPDNVIVTDIDEDAGTLTLEANIETTVPGRYGLWFSGGTGHLRLGEIVDHDSAAGTVTRPIEVVDFGTPVTGPARWDGYYYATDPDAVFDVTCTNVHVDSEVGPLPAWYIPANDPARPGTPPPAASRWAVLVHGRGATRHETLRAVPVLHDQGFDVLISEYRNGHGAPASPDGLYNLGLSEWRDVESAVQYATTHGATEVVLFGWSMGGAIVLQMLDLSPLSSVVSRVVLDSPVIDWVDVIAHQARLRHVPNPLAVLAQGMIGTRWARHLVGVHEPIDVARTSWQVRSDELHHPILLIHSVADDFVPVGPSQKLAACRPDLVRYEEWQVARHVKEWNTDTVRWERVVAEFVASPW